MKRNDLNTRRSLFSTRRIMLVVALVAVGIAGASMLRRRAGFLEEAARHAAEENRHDELARDLGGEPLDPPSVTVTALLPDGTAVRFVGRGPARRPHYPPDALEAADEATVKRLVAMCREEAGKEGEIRREYERKASRPWLYGDRP